MTSVSDAQEWARNRREAAAAQADRLARARAVETERARELLLGFVAEARRRGLATVELRARTGDGRTTYRTGLVGWYLKRDGSLGVTADGDYHLLVRPGSLRARLTGVTLQPTDPPLQVGAGARDGESVALDVLLAMRLEAGDDWPVRGG
jgi:hypothetical protein